MKKHIRDIVRIFITEVLISTGCIWLYLSPSSVIYNNLVATIIIPSAWFITFLIGIWIRERGQY